MYLLVLRTRLLPSKRLWGFGSINSYQQYTSARHVTRIKGYFGTINQDDICNGVHEVVGGPKANA